MPTPRRSRRFGSSASHQKLMMANLTASLFAAEGISTSEAKAKHPPPDRREVNHEGEEGAGGGPDAGPPDPSDPEPARGP